MLFRSLKALRKAPHTRRVPVIVMTALEDRDYEAKIRNLGVNALLYKPCDPEALLAMTREMLDLVPRIDDRILVKTRRRRAKNPAEP